MMPVMIPVKPRNFRLWIAAHRWSLAVSWLVIGLALQLVAR
jgi:hypothetical protein